ncbi:MAG: hypothetical protein Ta2B_00460 [Termitinemataceae bacterium]|nr:MAG: hypothetical protein Ta2B_00460 [Termitinemataceae bacterium]
MKLYRNILLPMILLFLGYSCFSLEIYNFDEAYEKIYFENYRVEFEFHLSNIKYSNKIETLITKLIYNDKNFEEYMAYKENEFIGDINEQDFPTINDDGAKYCYHSNYIETYEITNINSYFLTIKYTNYYYITGSAHGYFQTKYCIIDLLEGKILNINDLINVIPESELLKLIEQKYKDFNINYDSFSNNLWPPDTINFEINGIILFWNIYSIAPYSFGPIEINIPYGIINSYLTQKGELLRETYLIK